MIKEFCPFKPNKKLIDAIQSARRETEMEEPHIRENLQAVFSKDS